MYKILFVCHGNICRSPMAEALFKDIIKKNKIENDFYVDSAATSYEAIGESVHHGTRDKLADYGISVDGMYSRKLKKIDFDDFDYILTMDKNNMNNIKREFGSYDKTKVIQFLSFAGNNRDIADPWYTGNFNQTYDDILESCLSFLKYLGYNIKY
ncbi:low molecular weight protein-tyrosine-phosphatase [Peptostreptococcus equinus]|uniref:protein-tyrosine-phosphatase n=1 Tax=Peptostreptococcus equinus TaxID=3003601 RepID=A0ABY7JT16_9FIRM|nr:low molecular weight protein-tyrosine-phosphatase [Peptostreptococcus sp. CBA3647]WAW15616.1 low molecular weight phosphotyrosine protein phosphatase [Peptostreptococcus sp. CBA3647]